MYNMFGKKQKQYYLITSILKSEVCFKYIRLHKHFRGTV